MTSPRVRLWYALLVSFIACVVVAGCSVGYASWVNTQSQKRAELARQESDRRWCGLFAALDPPGAPPTNERGTVIAEEIHKLRVGFGCPER